MQRRRGRGNNNNQHTQDEGTSRKLSKKPSEEKCPDNNNDKEKGEKKKGGGAGVLRKLGFILHPEKQDLGSTLKRRKAKKGTERKRRSSSAIWNPDKKIHFNIEKSHATIPLKGDPISDIQKKVFFKFASDAVKKSPPEYSAEFLTKVKPYPGNPMERKIFDANPTKNRYKDVICNDITRVILNDGYDNDYIHANYVNGLNTQFILTQGPTSATVVDFWRMIVHTKSAYIVMLCDIMEDGKPKCASYYPEKVGDSVVYGPWTVLCSLEDEKDANIIKRTLSVKNSDSGKEHILKHLHTKSWPDRSVPNSTMALLRMLYFIRTATGPVTVHCSAGIGRTGTFVAMEACLQILTDGKELDLLTTCKALRNSRAGSIQVDIQYMTLVQMLMNYGKDNGYWEDSDLDDRVELLTWNIEQFIQTRGKVDHILATPSTPAANIPASQPAPLQTAPALAPPPPTATKETTPHQSPVQKAQECMEKICDKILKPIKKDKEHKSPKEHHKGEKILHLLPTTATKSSTEDGEDGDIQMQATQKVEMKEVKEAVVKTEEEGVLTGAPLPPPHPLHPPHPPALPSPIIQSPQNTQSKDSKESNDHLNTKVSKELGIIEKRTNSKEHLEPKLMRKLSANRSQYFM